MPLSAPRLENRRRENLRSKARRRLRVETLEDRRLLAVLAADGFESGNFNGGSEQWASDSWDVSGDATVRSDTSPASGSEHARLRRSSGDLQRTVDVSGFADIRLQFSAKLISFEGSDRADVKISGDGTNWTTVQTFVNGDDDGQYHAYDLAVPDVGNTLHIRFDAGMSGSADYWFIDDVQVTGVQSGPPTISISDTSAIEGDTNLQFLDRFIAAPELVSPLRTQVFGPDRNGDGKADLYVASGATDEVLVFDGISGILLGPFVSAGSGGLNDPVDLKFGPNGNLFIDSSGTNSADPNSNAILEFNGQTGAPVGVFATGLTRAISFDFGDNGDLYVGNRGTNEVLRFDGSTGALVGTLIPSAGGTSGQLRQALVGPDANNDGARDVYVLNDLGGSVLKYDGVSGAFLGVHTQLIGFDKLMWADFDSQGSLHTAARVNGGAGPDIAIFRTEAVTGVISQETVVGEAGWSLMLANDDVMFVSTNSAGAYIDRYAPGGVGTFAVNLSLPSNTLVTVDFSSTAVSAFSGTDYAPTSGKLTFSPGVTSRTIIVPTLDDSEVESDETFSVNLSNPVGATILDATGIGTILDDESRREIEISDTAAVEGSTELGFIDRFVSDGSGGLSRTRMSTFGPDANGDGKDDLYVASAASNQILVYDGVSGAFIQPFADVLDPLDLQFSPVDGSLYVSSFDGSEVVRFNGQTGAYIDTPISGLPDGPWGLTIADDGTLFVAVAGATDQVLKYDGTSLTTFISSGTSGLNAPHKAVFGPDGHVYINTNGNDSNGNAKQVLRFDGTTGNFLGVVTTLSLESSAWVDFDSHGMLYVSGRGPTGNSIVKVDPSSGAVIDTYDLGRDGWSFMLGPDDIIYSSTNSILPGSYIERIGPGSIASFDVTLSSASGLPVAVDFSTTDIDAIAGSDYQATSGTLIFEPGVTARTIIVPTIDDADAENVETFSVSLSNPIGGVIPNPTPAVGYIFDNDATNEPPLVDAGDDQTLIDTDGNGSEAVTLSGFAFDLDGSIDSAEWTLDGNVIGTTPIVNTTLPVGVHTITLTATDNQGASSSDTLIVTIIPAPTEVVLFEDSFEVGSNGNDWNGKWVEDSQNDFFRSTQRSTHGSRSAEVDGWAYNATLTLATPIDLSGHTSNTLTFDWLIEKGFDNGEFLSLDVSTNGGSSWIYDVRRLSGNVDAENTWHSESVDLSGFASSNLLIRFRSYVSSSREDANVDNVRIAGYSGGGGGGSLMVGSSGGSSDGASMAAAVLSQPVADMDPLDVNQDGYTTPLDALLVVNWLNQPSPGSAPASLDTNEDGHVTPVDMLLIVNKLNAETSTENADAGLAPALDAYAIDDFFGEMEEEDESVLGGDLLSPF